MKESNPTANTGRYDTEPHDLNCISGNIEKKRFTHIDQRVMDTLDIQFKAMPEGQWWPAGIGLNQTDVQQRSLQYESTLSDMPIMSIMREDRRIGSGNPIESVAVYIVSLNSDVSGERYASDGQIINADGTHNKIGFGTLHLSVTEGYGAGGQRLVQSYPREALELVGLLPFVEANFPEVLDDPTLHSFELLNVLLNEYIKMDV